MANLKSPDYLKLEKLFTMSSGYVLDFTNATFQQFIRNNAQIDIYSPKYQIYGDSKAKRLRAFWETEEDPIVGKLISEMIEHWRTLKMLANADISAQEKMLCKDCEELAQRLLGKNVKPAINQKKEKSEQDFLHENYDDIKLDKLAIESGLRDILNLRIAEINRCLNSDASLAAIFLCGSTLEGLLLGVATQNPQKFNQASASPKDSATCKIKPFPQWTLSDFINVAHELNLLGLDVKKFSHVLREFRNYIHPYTQWQASFNPDKHTAQICWQVVKATICDLTK